MRADRGRSTAPQCMGSPICEATIELGGLSWSPSVSHGAHLEALPFRDESCQSDALPRLLQKFLLGLAGVCDRLKAKKGSKAAAKKRRSNQRALSAARPVSWSPELLCNRSSEPRSGSPRLHGIPDEITAVAEPPAALCNLGSSRLSTSNTLRPPPRPNSSCWLKSQSYLQQQISSNCCRHTKCARFNLGAISHPSQH